MSHTPETCSCAARTADVAAAVTDILAQTGTGKEAAIPILQALQNRFGYLPEEALRLVTRRTRITAAELVGVATFYGQFRLKPAGKHVLRVCHGTACHVKGAERVDDAIRRELGLQPGQDTDARGEFTVERVGCVGCCTLAPVVQGAQRTFGGARAETVRDLLEAIRQGSSPAALTACGSPDPADASGGEIRIGVGSCCVAGGSAQVRAALLEALRLRGRTDVRIKPVGCVGMCHQTPLVEISLHGQGGTLYTRVRPEQAAAIVRRHFRSHGLGPALRDAWRLGIDRLAQPGEFRTLPPGVQAVNTPAGAEYRDPHLEAFLGPQRRLATECCGRLDPLDVDEYLRHDGFAAWRSCGTPESIIDIITRAGLRGRGGAGFPTGRKWDLTRAAVSPDGVKYIICNGDEGDPGAFMDRMILESYPYRVLEGMAIAAKAVGAAAGYLYIRAEYPLAVERIRKALAVCHQRGLLGGLDLQVKEGAGAFVCGEETALIASIEGRRGMPALKPPYPAQSGLRRRPTCINNVETYALVPWILRHGADAFAAIGTPASKGTKVFALTGKIRRGGLIEVPMGITLRQIVQDIGGGVAGDGRSFKAVQIGGPSGGCVPASLADTPVDFESLAQVGAIMGSGGLVVLDDRDCMVDIARYFLQFTQAESCGKCTCCRIGTKRMLEILERLCAGKARRGDLQALEQLALQVKAGSVCGLGQTAPNPVLSTLRYFREEYEAHLAGYCPAGKCKALIHYAVNNGCIGCTKCAQACPEKAIPFTPYQVHTIDTARCTRCDLCRSVCPNDAIVVRSGPQTAPRPMPMPLEKHAAACP